MENVDSMIPSLSEIIQLKNQGYTQQEVADEYNTTKYYVQQKLRSSGVSWGRVGYRKSRKWIDVNQGT